MGTPEERVVAASAVQRVDAIAAFDPIFAVTAAKDVIAAAANKFINSRFAVGFGGNRRVVGERVVAQSAVEFEGLDRCGRELLLPAVECNDYFAADHVYGNVVGRAAALNDKPPLRVERGLGNWVLK